jgi:hypothetical protein
VIGPLALIGRGRVVRLGVVAAADSVGWWIIASVLLDGVFSRVLRVALQQGAAPDGRHHSRRSRTWVLFALILVEALEAIVLIAGAIVLMMTVDPGDLGDISRAILSAAGGARLAWSRCWRPSSAERSCSSSILGAQGRRRARILGGLVKRLTQAVWLHRLSAVLVLALFVFTCIPAADVLDQLPDLQRSGCRTWGADWAAVWEAARHTLLALVARSRSPPARPSSSARARTRALAASTSALDIPPLAEARALVVGPHPGVGVAVDRHGPHDRHLGARLVGHSLPGRPRLRHPELPAPWRARVADHPAIRPAALRARWAWLTGDAIAVSIAGIAGTRPRALLHGARLHGGGAAEPREASRIGCQFGLLVTGLAMAVGSPFLLASREPRVPEPQRTRASRRPSGSFALLDPERRVDELAGAGALRRLHLILMVGFFVAGVLVLAWVGFLPVGAAALVGAPGLTVLLLTAWGAVLGAFTVGVQEHPPAPIFRFMRLRADPVLTLAITVPLVWSVVAAGLGIDDGQLHATRTGPDAAAGTSADAPETRRRIGLRRSARRPAR